MTLTQTQFNSLSDAMIEYHLDQKEKYRNMILEWARELDEVEDLDAWASQKGWDSRKDGGADQEIVRAKNIMHSCYSKLSVD